MSPGIAATQSIVLPVLGEGASDWEDGLAHVATWATKITDEQVAEEYEASELAILAPPVLNTENAQQLATSHNDWLESAAPRC